MADVLVHRNLETNFKAWICTHAEPQTPHEEGEIVLCALCTELLNEGGKLVDEETGNPVLQPKS